MQNNSQWKWNNNNFALPEGLLENKKQNNSKKKTNHF